jgi:hypothetical protein
MVDHVQHIVQDGPELRTFMLFDEQMSHALRAPRNNTTESSHEFSYVLFSGRFYITHFIKMIRYSTATFSKLQQQFSPFIPMCVWIVVSFCVILDRSSLGFAMSSLA